jgi:hypothetical protein
MHRHLKAHLIVMRIVPFVILLVAAGNLLAQISPGKLSRFHEELEGLTKCTQCHELGKRELSSEKCLSCHSALKQRIENNQGFHTSATVTAENCAHCHVEHGGRDTELIYWAQGRASFDHALTGYLLQGQHARLECDVCHRPSFQGDWLSGPDTPDPQRTLLGLAGNCVTCHQDEHREELVDNCSDCHDYNGWQPASGFDHRRTGYILTGRHLEIECTKCHPWQQRPPEADPDMIRKKVRQDQYAKYSDIRCDECSACHQDPHQQQLGGKCSDCHSTDGFRSIDSGQFNHDLTGYPLAGRHRSVSCKLCHDREDPAGSLAHEECSSCHVDRHRGQFSDRPDGGACQSCHTVEGFLPTLYSVDAHTASSYPLVGSHLAIPCSMCHLPVSTVDGEGLVKFDFDSTDCHSCHEDVHRGQLDIWIEPNGCEYCHTTESWHQTSFDHKLARFPLTGRHREILCLKCHSILTDQGGSQVWMKPLALNCEGCHSDPHLGQFSEQGKGKRERACETCHSAGGWKMLLFDHELNTMFPLTGGHDNLSCKKCHPVVRTGAGEEFVRYRPTDSTCKECHGPGLTKDR